MNAVDPHTWLAKTLTAIVNDRVPRRGVAGLEGRHHFGLGPA